MILLPEKITELDPNLQWLVPVHLCILEEVVLGPREPRAGEPSLKEAEGRLNHALGQRDKRSERRLIPIWLRAHVREWLRGFPEVPFLTSLFERAARRREGSGTRDSRRRPTHDEGLRIARALLAGVTPPGPLDIEMETATAAAVLAGYELGTFSILPRARVRE